MLKVKNKKINQRRKWCKNTNKQSKLIIFNSYVDPSQVHNLYRGAVPPRNKAGFINVSSALKQQSVLRSVWNIKQIMRILIKNRLQTSVFRQYFHSLVSSSIVLETFESWTSFIFLQNQCLSEEHLKPLLCSAFVSWTTKTQTTHISQS